MNYYKIYFKLMQKGALRILTENPIDYHAHHIIPRSLGGPDIVLNIALLTTKEHKLAHKILRRYPSSFLEVQGTTRINCTYYLKETIKKTLSKKQKESKAISKAEQNRRAYEKRKALKPKAKTNAERMKEMRLRKKAENN